MAKALTIIDTNDAIHRSGTGSGPRPKSQPSRWSLHAEGVLQSGHFHYSSDQVQASRHEHFRLVQVVDDIDGVLDRCYGVDLLWVEPRNQRQPRLPQSVLCRKL